MNGLVCTYMYVITAKMKSIEVENILTYYVDFNLYSKIIRIENEKNKTVKYNEIQIKRIIVIITIETFVIQDWYYS